MRYEVYCKISIVTKLIWVPSVNVRLNMTKIEKCEEINLHTLDIAVLL